MSGELLIPPPVAIVTGASRGIGFCISDRFLASGHRVCLVDLDDGVTDAEIYLGERYEPRCIMSMKCDVSTMQGFREAFAKTKAKFGRIDILINNAGIVDELNPERTVAVNLVGVMNGCQLSVLFMGRAYGGTGGIVVNISSVSGLLPYPDAPVYSATKHALIGLTRSYGDSVHFDRSEIRYMAVCPHYTDTPMLKEGVTLNVYTPPAEVEPLSVVYVTNGVMKACMDKLNGSILLVHRGGMRYVNVPADLKMKIPPALH